MAKATLERASCENCGADVRENTQFCYNCGRRFAKPEFERNGTEPAEISGVAKTALDDLASELGTDDNESGDKLALAAAKRKESTRCTEKNCGNCLGN